jgi:chemotaxis family two-component system response regulator Rcp1
MVDRTANDNGQKELQVLLIEDNPGDVRLVKEIFKETQLPHRLTVVKDGVEAVTYLRRQRPHENATQPRLILLDLNLPKKGGLEMLEELSPELSENGVRVVILTNSEAERDLDQSFTLGAVSYMVKPIDAEKLSLLLESLQEK